MISRWKTLIPVLALAVCLGWAAQASAAKIDYVIGGFFYLQGTAMADGVSNFATNTGSVNTTFNDVSQTYPNPDNATVQTYSSSGICFMNPLGTSHVNIGMFATGYGASSDTKGQMNGSSSFTTGGSGYFLRLDSSKDQNPADPFNVSLTWTSSFSTGTFAGFSTGTFAGNAASDSMNITVNGTSVMSYDPQDTATGGSGGYKTFSYQGHNGDLIGIFLGGSGSLSYTGIGDGVTSGELFGRNDQSIDITATPLPGAIWLLGGGLAALAGFRRRRKS